MPSLENWDSGLKIFCGMYIWNTYLSQVQMLCHATFVVQHYTTNHVSFFHLPGLYPTLRICHILLVTLYTNGYCFPTPVSVPMWFIRNVIPATSIPTWVVYMLLPIALWNLSSLPKIHGVVCAYIHVFGMWWMLNFPKVTQLASRVEL